MTESTASATTTEAAVSPMAAWLIDRITFYDQVDPAAVTVDAPLAELGLDSIYVLTLCGDIEDAYGVAIDPTFFGDFETLGALADGLTARVDGA